MFLSTRVVKAIYWIATFLEYGHRIRSCNLLQIKSILPWRPESINRLPSVKSEINGVYVNFKELDKVLSFFPYLDIDNHKKLLSMFAKLQSVVEKYWYFLSDVVPIHPAIPNSTEVIQYWQEAAKRESGLLNVDFQNVVTAAPLPISSPLRRKGEWSWHCLSCKACKHFQEEGWLRWISGADKKSALQVSNSGNAQKRRGRPSKIEVRPVNSQDNKVKAEILPSNKKREDKQTEILLKLEESYKKARETFNKNNLKEGSSNN